jgi:hypothetical protein
MTCQEKSAPEAAPIESELAFKSAKDSAVRDAGAPQRTLNV